MTYDEYKRFIEIHDALFHAKLQLKVAKQKAERRSFQELITNLKKEYIELGEKLKAIKEANGGRNPFKQEDGLRKRRAILAQLTPESPELKDLIWGNSQFIKLQLIEMAVHEVLSTPAKKLVMNKLAEYEQRMKLGEQILHKEYDDTAK